MKAFSWRRSAPCVPAFRATAILPKRGLLSPSSSRRSKHRASAALNLALSFERKLGSSFLATFLGLLEERTVGPETADMIRLSALDPGVPEQVTPKVVLAGPPPREASRRDKRASVPSRPLREVTNKSSSACSAPGTVQPPRMRSRVHWGRTSFDPANARSAGVNTSAVSHAAAAACRARRLVASVARAAAKSPSSELATAVEPARPTSEGRPLLADSSDAPLGCA